MQVIHDIREGICDQLVLPDANTTVLKNISWGFACSMFTPAFWAAQAWLERENETGSFGIQWSSDLREEIVGCLLGGYGITYEVNSAAFERLKNEGLTQSVFAEEKEIEEALRRPLDIGGKSIRYRFPSQKSRYIYRALQKTAIETVPIGSPTVLRNWLVTFDGIGPKTASWITRNHCDTDDVAILDIHVIRAGVIMGLFPVPENIQKQYNSLEQRFLQFSKAIKVRAGFLDFLIWKNMRESGQIGLTAFRSAA